jgi:hypothetical protein
LPDGSYKLEDVFKLIFQRFRRMVAELPRSQSFAIPAATIRLTFDDDSRGINPPADWVDRLGTIGIKVDVDRYSASAAA